MPSAEPQNKNNRRNNDKDQSWNAWEISPDVHGSNNQDKTTYTIEKQGSSKRYARCNKVSTSDSMLSYERNLNNYPKEDKEHNSDSNEIISSSDQYQKTYFLLNNGCNSKDCLEDLSGNEKKEPSKRINSLNKKSRRKNCGSNYEETQRNNNNNNNNTNNNNMLDLSTSDNWNNLNTQSNSTPKTNIDLNIMPNISAKLDPLPTKSLEVDDLRCYPRHPISKDFTKQKTLKNERNLLTEERAILKTRTGSSALSQGRVDSNLECWMSNLPSEKRNLPLHRLLIPGSHDSFSYSLKWGEISPDSPAIIPYLAACFPCIAWPALLRWSITQRATVYEQLTHGIRYFDIRVAVRDSRFYFVHGLYGEDLEDLLGEIRKFLDTRREEVVLLDFQHLHGLSKEDHLFLGDLLKNVFAGLICPPYESLTHLSLSYLLKQKYQVLIFYRHSENQREFGFWSDSLLPNPWPRTTNISTMMSFVKKELEKKSHKKFFVTQCVLTPTGSYLSRNLKGSLKRKMADPCNKEVLQWILSLPSKNKVPNVIMTDFVDNDNWAIPKAIVRHNIRCI